MNVIPRYTLYSLNFLTSAGKSANLRIGASIIFNSPSCSLANLASISVPSGSAMLTGFSSQPSYVTNRYGVISLHPVPCPPLLPIGRKYVWVPSWLSGEKPGTLPGVEAYVIHEVVSIWRRHCVTYQSALERQYWDASSAQ